MLLENHGALAVGGDVVTAFYRMESLELWAKITINAVILGGSYDISRENIDKLIDLRGFYRVTGPPSGLQKYPRREKGCAPRIPERGKKHAEKYSENRQSAAFEGALRDGPWR